MIENYIREVFLFMVAIITIVIIIKLFLRLYKEDKEEHRELYRLKDIDTKKRLKKANRRKK